MIVCIALRDDRKTLAVDELVGSAEATQHVDCATQVVMVTTRPNAKSGPEADRSAAGAENVHHVSLPARRQTTT